MSSQLRMSGLISGLDTDSIISALVSSRQTKVDNTKGEQTKLQWKQDIWKDLNKEIKGLQTLASNMRYSTAYAKKTTSASNASKVSVITGSDAVNSTQSLKINKLAKTGYLTGGTVATTDGEDATALTKMSELGYSGNGTLDIKDGKGNVTNSIEITADTTISDVLTKLKDAGLNASFDAGNQRLFISSKTSGAANDFSITSSDDDGNEALAKLGLQTADYYKEKGIAVDANSSAYATKIDGSDAEIVLNGAKFTSNSNVFAINGLTITANSVTDENEEITLTTSNDTSGIYDTIKNFISKYNTIINKLDTFYNADSAKDYSVLTDDEKEAMSESEVEKYEQKIKDSLLKGDSTVSNIINSLTSSMQGSYDGKYLSSFGISTLNYFSSADNEKHALHIDGDSDDDSTSGNEDKLRAMITNDPEGVVSFFTQLSQSIYKGLSDLSTSVNGQRSFGSFYNDKKMTTDYASYTTKITSLEEKLNDYEDKLYKQYAAMETALAKLQQNSSAVTGLLGS